MANGTAYQKNKKNWYRPSAGEMGFKSSAGKVFKSQWKMCKTCGEKCRVEDMGRHQRKYLCLNCQPQLL